MQGKSSFYDDLLEFFSLSEKLVLKGPNFIPHKCWMNYVHAIVLRNTRNTDMFIKRRVLRTHTHIRKSAPECALKALLWLPVNVPLCSRLIYSTSMSICVGRPRQC